MGQFIGIALALLVGWATWGLTLAASNGTPLGPAGNLEALLFFAPVIGLAVPMALRAIRADAVAVAVWVGALAPLLGVANFLFYAGAIARPGAPDSPDWRSALILAAIWQLPLLVFAVGAALPDARRSRLQNQGPEERAPEAAIQDIDRKD